jgi:hypothetical protein
MWHYGFLAPPAPAGAERLAEGGTWDSREQWGEETRALFQTGQRLMRLGRNADAASYFEAVLDGHPGNPEATEMLAVIARGQSLAAAPLGERGPEVAPPAPPEPAPAVPAPPAPARRRAPWLALAAATLLVAGGAAAFLLTRRAPAPPPPAPVVAPAAAPPPAAPAPAAPAAPAWRTAKVERRTHPPAAELVSPAGGDFAWTAASDAKVAKGERVGELRVEVAGGRKDAALAKRVAELEALAAKDPVYRDFLDKARRDLRRAEAKRKTRPVPLLAPAAGLLARAPEPGGRAEEGERLARILDPSVWSLAALVDGPEPAADAACEVVGDVSADRAPCRLASRSSAGERTEVVADVPAAAAPWIARAASLWLRVAPAGTPRAETAAPTPAPAPSPQELPR